MDFELQNIEDYTKDLSWMLKALNQLEKEFVSESWQFNKPIDPKSAFDHIVDELYPKLDHLIKNRGQDYSKQLLYKIDISEQQVARAAKEALHSDFSLVLTKLIIRRCLQKVLIRNYYKSPEKDVLGSSLEE